MCFYCMKMGPTPKFFRFRMFYIPKGILKWVPKISKVPNVPVNAYGPKFIRGLNLAP